MYVAKRPLKVGETMRWIGEPVPEAEGWLRVESWVRFGFIKKVDDEPQQKKPQVHRRK